MTARRPAALPPIVPCPCGHTRTEITKSNASGLFSVWCNCCWIGPAERTKRAAILAWNRRGDAEAERRGAMAVADLLDEMGYVVPGLRPAIITGEVLPSAPEPSKKKAMRT